MYEQFLINSKFFDPPKRWIYFYVNNPVAECVIISEQPLCATEADPYSRNCNLFGYGTHETFCQPNLDMNKEKVNSIKHFVFQHL